MDWLSPLRELFGFAFASLGPLSIIRAILGFILVFFLPGFVWTIVFFKKTSVIERVTFSLALSIVAVTLSFLFISRLIGLRITWFSSTLVIIIVTILPVVAYYLNQLVKRRRGGAT